MNTYQVTYFRPSAPQQVNPLPPEQVTIKADEFIYDDGVVIFVDTTTDPHRQTYLLTIPLELMPIVQNQGPAAT